MKARLECLIEYSNPIGREKEDTLIVFEHPKEDCLKKKKGLAAPAMFSVCWTGHIINSSCNLDLTYQTQERYVLYHFHCDGREKYPLRQEAKRISKVEPAGMLLVASLRLLSETYQDRLCVRG